MSSLSFGDCVRDEDELSKHFEKVISCKTSL